MLGTFRRRAVAALCTAAVAGTGLLFVAPDAGASPAKSVTPDCTLTVGDRSYAYTRTVTLQAGGDDVQPGGVAHVTVGGASESLPTTSPYPQFVVGYTLVRVSYSVSGGTVVPGSLAKTSHASIDGHPITSSTVALLGSDTIMTTVNGPISAGDFVAAGFAFDVQAGTAGESIVVRAERATEFVRYQMTMGGANSGLGECVLGTNLTTIDVTGDAPATTVAPTTTTEAPTTTVAPTTTTEAPTTTTVARTTTVAPTTVPPTTVTVTTQPPTTTTVPPGSSGPFISVLDTWHPEPAKGEVEFLFQVNVENSNGKNKGTVKYRVLDGTAVHKADFATASGTLRFQDGRSTLWIKVKVKHDKVSDPNEVFYVELYDAKGGATIVRGRATGTILNG